MVYQVNFTWNSKLINSVSILCYAYHQLIDGKLEHEIKEINANDATVYCW